MEEEDAHHGSSGKEQVLRESRVMILEEGELVGPGSCGIGEERLGVLEHTGPQRQRARLQSVVSWPRQQGLGKVQDLGDEKSTCINKSSTTHTQSGE